MKKVYILTGIIFLLTNAFSQSSDPFDARTKKSQVPLLHDPAVVNAPRIDATSSGAGNTLNAQPAALQKQATAGGGFFVKYNGAGSSPTVIMRKPTAQGTAPLQISPEENAYAFLRDAMGVMKINVVENEFRAIKVDHDNLGQDHIRMQQEFANVKIWGKEIVLHTETGGQVNYLNGNFIPTPSIFSVVPLKQAADAVLSMEEHLRKIALIKELTPDQMRILHYAGPKVELVIFPVSEKNCKLAYHIIVRPDFINAWNYFIDANNGDVLDFYNSTCSANGPRSATANDLNGVSRSISTYEYNGRFYMVNSSKPMFNSTASVFPDQGVGVIETYNANNTDGSSLYNISNTTNSGWTAVSVSAHYNADMAFDYYKNTFSRNSINNGGGTITSIINVTSGGSAMDNAYWNGEAMYYGNGSTAFKPLAGALDVGGHEMTHGVVQNTANLEYKGQSGAINESMADIFGCMIDRADWQIGEDVTKTSYIPTGCLRDLSDPHNGGSSLSSPGWQPAKMSEYYTGTSDNNGVHTNSGITNKAFYLFATATTKAKAEQVYYRALSFYLTKTSQFLDLRYAVVKAATDLYGSGSSEVTALKNAFNQVEIFDPNEQSGGGTGGGGTTQTTPDDLSGNPGADYIVSYDLTGGSTKLYRSSTTGTNYVGLTTTDEKRRVTIPDNGSYCMFVDLSGNIRQVNLTSPYTESKLTTSGGWDNISISKDGKMLAAVSTDIDTAIYIYSFPLQQWRRFQLYNPTYSNVNGAGVNYADGLEWDNTGQFVIYDAHNVMKNNSGTDKTYWDVGILKVWDLKGNTWGDGKIEKLFSSLPDDVSIGNPIFSKNSPYIIAFDYIDNSGTTPEYAVIGTNIISNKTSLITTNTKLGFPNYSKGDNKMIVDGEDLSTENIYVISLNADKISATGTAPMLIPDAKWGYWYATGTRSLLLNAKKILAYSVGSPPVTATISGNTITATVPATTNISNLAATFSLSYDAYAKVSGVEQVSGVSGNNFSSTVIYTVYGQDGSSQNYFVTVSKAGGINSSPGQNSVHIYPNPFHDFLELETKGFGYELYDMTGKLLMKEDSNLENVRINTSLLEPGIYLIKTGDPQNPVWVRVERN
jgi:Zn-dependent metalloprotease